jgi:putative aminopeptidase FrvX
MNDYLVTETTARVITILDTISRPAAPFYEAGVSRAIQETLRGYETHPNVHIFTDRYGNLVAQYRHPDARYPSALAVAAHMDHPGYHIVSAENGIIEASIQGGLPRDERLIGSHMLMFRDHYSNRGTITGFTDASKTAVTVEPESGWEGPAQHAWGVPDVTRFALDGDFIRGRAMDDLAGCAQQIAALEILVRLDIKVEYTAVFNRAEEVGFIGAIGACESKVLPDHAVVLCLEASKALEGARAGHGVIIRTGDRLAMFDPQVTERIEQAAANAAKKQIRYQKKRMDGGTCEAALYMSYGYETGAIAVPLINYHNHGDTSVEAEAIHRDDLAGGVVVLVELARILETEKRLPRSLFREKRKAAFYETIDRLTENTQTL